MAAYAENRKARFAYEILETLSAGIELLGFEVKAIRAGRMTLDGAHVTVRGGEAFLIGAGVAPLQPKNIPAGYDERRNRKLLVTKKEIAELAAAEDKRGLTIVPISVYNKNRKIKADIAVCRGKKAHDKRDTLRKRAIDRDLRRTLKE